MSYYNNKPKRKINPPKRFITETTNDTKEKHNKNNKNNKKEKKEKNEKNEKNKYCNGCNILINLNYMYCFEYDTKLYCDVCYNDLETYEDEEDEESEDEESEDEESEDEESEEEPKQKINFIIMQKLNPNLIKITHKTNNEETEEENNDDEEENEEENEEEVDDKDDTNTLFNFINNKTNTKNNDKNNKYYYNYNENDTSNKDNTKTTNFDNLFFSSLINRIENIANNSDILNNENNKNKNNKNNKNQKNKGNKNKDDEYDEDDKTLEYEWLGSDIKDIDDLIRIGNTYNPKKRKRHNLNLKKLNKLVEPLTELKNMIGMKEVKKIIFDQLIYYLQNLDDKNVDMLHTVIVGPPGVGKTQLTYIIAKIYNKLGFLKTDKVVCAKRDDLIGEYIGQTAPKTRKILDSALGGVLLLDEVYALSPNSEKDFAREAIDMINVYLSEHCHDLVCVIAGYKRPTYDNFLKHNEGLARRFTHHFEIKGYNAEELTLIFKKYVEEQKWGLLSSVEEMIPIIEKHLKIFPNFGGDMTTLFACCKKTHSKRLLLIPTEEELNDTKKKIHTDDIEKGIQLFIDIKEKGEEIDDIEKYVHMYS